MDIKQFKSGFFSNQYGYKSFTPNHVNENWIVSNSAINELLEKANWLLGQLDAFSTLLPDVNILVHAHILKESVESSRIEGTRTNIIEAALREKDINPEKKDDWNEVHNYIDAMNLGIQLLENLPICSRLIRQVHATLLKGVRGEHRLPGEYRTSQNWIGGHTLKDASFIPPHHSLIPDLLSDLEKFLNNNAIQVPHLIRIGIAHYQFETIHPFLDGNGRIGRLLITLYLINKGLLKKPTLYLSAFIEKNKSDYYSNLQEVRLSNSIENWIIFFLTGVIETAHSSIQAFYTITSLREELEASIQQLGKRLQLAKKLLSHLHTRPTITLAESVELLKITKQTANTLIREFVQLGILKEKTGYKRNRIFVFEKFLNIFS